MTVRKLSRILFLILMTLSVTFPALAAKRRAVGRAGTARLDVVLTGTVVDASTNAPVVAADVSVAALGLYTTTNRSGNFTLTLPAGLVWTVEISRVGYTLLQVPVSIQANTTQRFTLAPGNIVQIRMTNGQTVQLDFETVEFGFLTGPFGTFLKSPRLSLCKPGGSAFTPDRTAIKRIIGPATSTTHIPCCTTPISAINIEMKNGENTTAYLADTCGDRTVEVVGMEHVKFEPLFVTMGNIAEMIFP